MSSGQELDDRTVVASELLDIAFFVVGDARLPKVEDNANPLEGQAAHGRLMAEAALPLQSVVGVRPPTESTGLVGELVEGLAKELGTSKPPPHDLRLAAALRDGGDAAVLLHLAGVLIALAIVAQSDFQSWR